VFVQIYLISTAVIGSDYPLRRTYIISAFPECSLSAQQGHVRK